MTDSENLEDQGPAELREALKRRDTRIAELEAAAAQAVEASNRMVAQSQGLPPPQVELFLKTHEGEVTPEAVQGWAKEYGLSTQPSPQNITAPTSNLMGSAGEPQGSPVGETSRLSSQEAMEQIAQRGDQFLVDAMSGRYQVDTTDPYAQLRSTNWTKWQQGQGGAMLKHLQEQGTDTNG